MSENVPIEQFGGFHLLLKRNVLHIWEQIFLSLDYESLRNCLKVSKAWNEVFNKQSFRAKILSKFSTQMLMDVEKLERKIWKSSKNILVWTANSEEVAYVEDRHKNCQIIHFINQSGELRSRKVKGMSARFGVGNIWIIHNIILVKTDSNLYAITKEGLEQSTITSFDKDDPIQAFTTHFNPVLYWGSLLVLHLGKFLPALWTRREGRYSHITSAN